MRKTWRRCQTELCVRPRVQGQQKEGPARTAGVGEARVGARRGPWLLLQVDKKPREPDGNMAALGVFKRHSGSVSKLKVARTQRALSWDGLKLRCGTMDGVRVGAVDWLVTFCPSPFNWLTFNPLGVCEMQPTSPTIRLTSSNCHSGGTKCYTVWSPEQLA